jgi:hypothetical protein
LALVGSAGSLSWGTIGEQFVRALVSGLCSLRCGVSITKARQLGQRHCRHIPEGRERKRSGMQALAHAERNIMRWHEGSVLKEQRPVVEC